MIAIQLLNDQASVSQYNTEDNKEYTPGEIVKINFQIIDPQTGNRLIPGTSATCNVIVQNSDGSDSTIEAEMIANPDDRSLWSFEMTATQTTNLVGSNFQVVLDFLGDASDIRYGMAYNVLSKIVFDDDIYY